ncbi:MAG: thioredoxin family protein [Bryobacterales bacterium]|nr:thioredoxin family protein [Bryobacterales bacterium]
MRLLCLLAVFATLSPAQRTDPVQWTLAIEPATAAPGAKVLIKLTATIEEGWHLYSTTTPPGPIPTRILLAENPAVKGVKLHQPKPATKFDPNFKADSETYEKQAVFLIETEVDANAARGPIEVTAQARYQVCSDTTCLRPVRKTASAKLTINPGVRTLEPKIPEGYVAGSLATSATPAAAPAGQAAAPAKPAPVQQSAQDQGLFQFVLVAFGFGLAAVFTPCVFPMIPITMSFFLRQGGGKGSVSQAVLFCLGIVVLFTALGLITTAVLGPFGVVQLGSNVWVNAFIATLFLVFGLSLLGAFEITLPSGLLTRLDQASQKGGVLGTLLMGLTFSLTSFACVGPFVGTLLAASVQGGGLQPAIGMASFAAGLASPFFLLALFPSYLQRMPKSGGWLPRVKVVMGFIILAFVFKYLSNIDQVMQWGLLTRERFLAAWIVLFAMPGLYLLGFIRLDGIKADQQLGVSRAVIAIAFLIFAISLWPGMNCARLGELDAYIPACAEQSGGAPGSASAAQLKWIKNDYQQALKLAREQNKLVFVNFTGYACTNCHWMKANMFTRPEVIAALDGFVLVELYTDGTDAASEANQKLQETKFNTVAIPHYAILDGSENVLANFVGLTKKPAEFLSFINAPKQTKAASL